MKSQMFFLLLFLVLTTASSCSSATALSSQIKKAPATTKNTKQEISRRVSSVSKKSNDDYASRLKSFNLNYSSRHYEFWKNYFTKRERALFQRHLKNSFRMEKVVKEIFRRHGLPEDLFYVGLIESGYNMKIRSRANAVGPWQFVKGTAKSYGLRVDSQVDERYNIFKSTEAAAHYFKDLYNIFGSWELALCAYNKGEYGMIRAIRKGNTRNYQTLVKKGLIPKETVYYIPKLAAARYLMQNARRHGFRDSPSRLSSPVALQLTRTFTRKEIIEKMGISINEFLAYNTDLKAGTIRPNRGGHRLYFPSRLRNRMVSRFELVPGSQVPSLRGFGDKFAYKLESDAGKVRYYKVKKGDNLSSIASRFGTSWPQLKRYNNLKSSHVWYGQRLKIPPSSSSKTYTVKSGDNLSVIARRFKISVNRLKEINGLKNSRVYPSQKLLVSL